ncbi:MAG: hypothetical protein CMG00_04075, partial [Candidatus Marinimicrobia bacterium]|nr:hypothetical protein [Candidatus Neomarinimicrobiota bacterium]
MNKILEQISTGLGLKSGKNKDLDRTGRAVGASAGDVSEQAKSGLSVRARREDLEEDETFKFTDRLNPVNNLFINDENYWKKFMLDSLSYSLLVLIIGIIGGNLENLSHIQSQKMEDKSNAYKLRNKFEGLFKHSLSAGDKIKLDDDVHDIDDETFPLDLKVWCSFCDLSIQAKLLLQSWPLKIFDYANYAMCNISFSAFNNFFTKGKAFKAYFMPILLIILMYFQIPLILGFLVALFGSTFHPNFPIYWLGIFAYLAQIKSIVKTSFNYLYGVIPCRRYYAFPRWNSAFNLRDDNLGYTSDPDDVHIDEVVRLLNELTDLEYTEDHMLGDGAKEKREATGRDLFEIIKNTNCSNIKVINYKGKDENIGNAACLNLEGSDADNIGSTRGDNATPFDIFYSLIPKFALNSDGNVPSARDMKSDHREGGPSRVIKQGRLGDKSGIFKYVASPICIAEVNYLKIPEIENEEDIYKDDVVYWLWSKTTIDDRKKLYNDLKSAIDQDKHDYWSRDGAADLGAWARGDPRQTAMDLIDAIRDYDIAYDGIIRMSPLTDANIAPFGVASSLRGRKYLPTVSRWNRQKKKGKYYRRFIRSFVHILLVSIILYKAFTIAFSKHNLIDKPRREGVEALREAQKAKDEAANMNEQVGGGPPKSWIQM